MTNEQKTIGQKFNRHLELAEWIATAEARMFSLHKSQGTGKERIGFMEMRSQHIICELYIAVISHATKAIIISS